MNKYYWCYSYFVREMTIQQQQQNQQTKNSLQFQANQLSRSIFLANSSMYTACCCCRSVFFLYLFGVCWQRQNHNVFSLFFSYLIFKSEWSLQVVLFSKRSSIWNWETNAERCSIYFHFNGSYITLAWVFVFWKYFLFRVSLIKQPNTKFNRSKRWFWNADNKLPRKYVFFFSYGQLTLTIYTKAND